MIKNDSNLINFFYREYAWRKLYIDDKNGIVDFALFKKNFFEIFRCVVKKICGQYIEFEGVIQRTDDFVDRENAYKLLRYQFCPIVDFIIADYNNSLTDNPAFKYQLLDSEKLKYSEFSNDIIQTMGDKLKYVHSICIKYGHFPKDLLPHLNIVKYLDYLDKDIIPFHQPFLCFNKNSKILRTNFISENGKSYFEEDDGKSLYVYCNYLGCTKIEEIINTIKINILRRKKVNFKRELIFHPEPNIQICINIDDIFAAKEILNDVRQALFIDFLYFKEKISLPSKDSQDALSRSIDAKYKKISYFYRIVGLHIWDSVHILNAKLSNTIKALLFFNPPESVPSVDESKHTPELNQKHTVLLSKLIFERMKKASVPDYSLLYSEYRLAVKCIQDLSIHSHTVLKGGGIHSN